MPTIDLAAKYGRSAKSAALVNRAIRAELAGGGHCLDAVAHLDRLRHARREAGEVEGMPEIEAALGAAHEVYRRMRSEIRRRYGMPPEQG